MRILALLAAFSLAFAGGECCAPTASAAAPEASGCHDMEPAGAAEPGEGRRGEPQDQHDCNACKACPSGLVVVFAGLGAPPALVELDAPLMTGRAGLVRAPDPPPPRA